MRIMSAEIDDIRRVLAICFRDGISQTVDDLERVLSFDMGWMDTDTAHEAINAMTVAGWMVNKDGELSPNCDLRGVIAPLGWQPRPSRLIEPVVNVQNLQVTDIPSKSKVDETKIKNPEENSDPRAKLERRLAKFISKSSGISTEEVIRRADRKVKALNYCTKWLALCLVSREQNLEMNSIIDSLSRS